MSTTVRITETYDLKTTVNKMGIIGIHTPSSVQIRRMYPGLVKNHRYMRILKCDVVGVCASALPADPLQVGVENGQVAPEDMFNPILYKAVSNESFESVVSYMYRLADVGDFGSVVAGTLNTALSDESQFNMYYAFLASKDGWKKAMPQNGFALRGLYPICYQMINTFGNQHHPVGQEAYLDGVGELGVTNDRLVDETSHNFGSTTSADIAASFRGRSVKMPRIPMHFAPEGNTSAPNNFDVPKTYVGLFLIPPARMVEFYYRLRVSWLIRFEEVVSSVALGNATSVTQMGTAAYHKNFSYASSEAKLENTTDSVDTNNVAIEKIMES